jgi:hypothetical protein
MEFSVSHGRDTRGEYSAALTDLLAVGFGPRGPRGPTIGNHRRSHASTVTRTILGLSSSPSSCCGSSSRRATGASPRFCAGCPSFGMHPGRQRCPTIPGFARRRNPAVRYGPGNGAATRPGTPPPRGRKTRPVWSRGTLPPVRCPRRVRRFYPLRWPKRQPSATPPATCSWRSWWPSVSRRIRLSSVRP